MASLRTARSLLARSAKQQPQPLPCSLPSSTRPYSSCYSSYPRASSSLLPAAHDHHRRRQVSRQIRNASTSSSSSSSPSKLPKGFTPPTQADLDELRERVQEFTRRELTAEVAAATDKSNSFPQGMWERLGDAGFLGVTADEDVGGLAMGYQAHCVVMEELSRASGSVALSYAAHSQLASTCPT
ncbi:hypothetical protein VTK73DRAFT_3703 [Phialemonium thermophilum]|uniref:Acyl-CoA dehydrogenase/oxidase N-terminal domain-containing protein n=1 Tax=Phialemonium thermophilum TaxID=223376 RepID=A0ABR3VG63_9PEZI